MSKLGDSSSRLTLSDFGTALRELINIDPFDPIIFTKFDNRPYYVL